LHWAARLCCLLSGVPAELTTGIKPACSSLRERRTVVLPRQQTVSVWWDLNPRSLRPERSAIIPDFATHGCGKQDSNLRHLPCRGSVATTELFPRKFFTVLTLIGVRCVPAPVGVSGIPAFYTTNSRNAVELFRRQRGGTRTRGNVHPKHAQLPLCDSLVTASLSSAGCLYPARRFQPPKGCGVRNGNTRPVGDTPRLPTRKRRSSVVLQVRVFIITDDLVSSCVAVIPGGFEPTIPAVRRRLPKPVSKMGPSLYRYNILC
jgi:hypothetical protein